MAYASAQTHRTAEVIGHRGAPREHRENTLPSFERALAEGADAVELDVHGTSDGIVVIHHDPVTNSRPADSGPRVALSDTTFAELTAVPIAGGATIPTLSDLLDRVPDMAKVYVEVKAAAIEASVVSVVRDSGKRCAVHSFDHRIARRVHELAPALPVGILQTSYPIDPIRPMRDAGARDLWQHWELIDAELIDRVQASGGRVIAWTVNDVAVAQRLAAWGIDGICTDLPGQMRRVIDESTR